MQITRETNRLIRSMYSTAAVTIFAAAAVVGAQAQSPVAAPADTLNYPALNFRASLDAPLDLSAVQVSTRRIQVPQVPPLMQASLPRAAATAVPPTATATPTPTARPNGPLKLAAGSIFPSAPPTTTSPPDTDSR
jgi:hypothetical protein